MRRCSHWSIDSRQALTITRLNEKDKDKIRAEKVWKQKVNKAHILSLNIIMDSKHFKRVFNSPLSNNTQHVAAGWRNMLRPTMLRSFSRGFMSSVLKNVSLYFIRALYNYVGSKINDTGKRFFNSYHWVHALLQRKGCFFFRSKRSEQKFVYHVPLSTFCTANPATPSGFHDHSFFGKRSI